MAKNKILSKFREYLTADKGYEGAISKRVEATAEETRTKLVRNTIEEEIITLIEESDEHDYYFNIGGQGYKISIANSGGGEDEYLDIDTIDIIDGGQNE